MSRSLLERFSRIPEDERPPLSEEYQALLKYCWPIMARPEQIAPMPGECRYWLPMTGRGWGKTRAGAETVRREVEAGRAKRIGLIGGTIADVYETMIGDPLAGLLAVCPPWNKPEYLKTPRPKLTWTNSDYASYGAVATGFSAEKPKRLRGPQHDLLWADEIATWGYPEAWDMAKLGLRLGSNPWAIITTTPQPIQLLRDLIANKHCVVTGGTTQDNRANLAPAFYEEIISDYFGTTLWDQEILGLLLEKVIGALWDRDTMIDPYRVIQAPECTRIVTAIDPAVTALPESSETGIVTVGMGPPPLDPRGNEFDLGWQGPEHFYVLEDNSLRAKPLEWARIAIGTLDRRYGDRIIGEVNNGGDLVESNLRTIDPDVPFSDVRASKGKLTRAEPISSLYEQGRVHHVGVFKSLELQLCTWVQGDDSPDRLDALVWAITHLKGEAAGGLKIA
jgi:phage terminase large subunit-like protein